MVYSSPLFSVYSDFESVGFVAIIFLLLVDFQPNIKHDSFKNMLASLICGIFRVIQWDSSTYF